jgi:hypothetical protein
VATDGVTEKSRIFEVGTKAGLRWWLLLLRRRLLLLLLLFLGAKAASVARIDATNTNSRTDATAVRAVDDLFMTRDDPTGTSEFADSIDLLRRNTAVPWICRLCRFFVVVIVYSSSICFWFLIVLSYSFVLSPAIRTK